MLSVPPFSPTLAPPERELVDWLPEPGLGNKRPTSTVPVTIVAAAITNPIDQTIRLRRTVRCLVSSRRGSSSRTAGVGCLATRRSLRTGPTTVGGAGRLWCVRRGRGGHRHASGRRLDQRRCGGTTGEQGGERGERGARRGRGRWTLGRLLGEQPADQFPEPVRHVVGAGRRRGLVALHDRDRVLGVERCHPAQHLVEHDARAVQSAAGVAGSPPASSGAAYSNVPVKAPAWVSVLPSMRANPKSPSLAWLRSSVPRCSSTLSGLTSRCKIPAACNAASPSHTSATSRAASTGARVPWLASSRRSDGPSTYSSTSASTSPSITRSRTPTTCGCRIADRTVCSRTNRARTVASVAYSGRNSFAATISPVRAPATPDQTPRTRSAPATRSCAPAGRPWAAPTPRQVTGRGLRPGGRQTLQEWIDAVTAAGLQEGRPKASVRGGDWQVRGFGREMSRFAAATTESALRREPRRVAAVRARPLIDRLNLTRP